jgi:hypothetical protein
MRRVVILCVLLVMARPAFAQDADAKAVEKAKGFLDSAKPWPFVNLCVHFGTDFMGKTYAKTLSVKNKDGVVVPGQFALVYDYKWTGQGETQIAFLCDTKGNIFKVQVLADNGVFNQPFALGDASIKLIGDALYDALKKDLNENDRKTLRQLVDAASAQRLLEFGLRVQQANP